VSASSRTSSFLASGSVKLDRLRDSLDALLRLSGDEEKQALVARLQEIRKDLDNVNGLRQRLAAQVAEIESALEALNGDGSLATLLAEVLFIQTIYDLKTRIHNMRPDKLLEEKAELKQRIDMIQWRKRAASTLLRLVSEHGRDKP
jgi:hypothetical protein